MTEGKTTDCVMEGIRLWKEVYTGKAVNVAMIQGDVLAVCKALLNRNEKLEKALGKLSRPQPIGDYVADLCNPLLIEELDQRADYAREALKN